jgi:hypothetical protein
MKEIKQDYHLKVLNGIIRDDKRETFHLNSFKVV